MANAVRTTKLVEKTIKVKEEMITLSLSQREAAVLTFILSHIVDYSGKSSLGKCRQNISDTLYTLGFRSDTLNNGYIDPTSSSGLRFRNSEKFEKEFPE